jgi:glycerol uptake facilitator-like aquaporin
MPKRLATLRVSATFIVFVTLDAVANDVSDAPKKKHEWACKTSNYVRIPLRPGTIVLEFINTFLLAFVCTFLLAFLGTFLLASLDTFSLAFFIRHLNIVNEYKNYQPSDKYPLQP